MQLHADFVAACCGQLFALAMHLVLAEVAAIWMPATVGATETAASAVGLAPELVAEHALRSLLDLADAAAAAAPENEAPAGETYSFVCTMLAAESGVELDGSDALLRGFVAGLERLFGHLLPVLLSRRLGLNSVQDCLLQQVHPTLGQQGRCLGWLAYPSL